MPDTFKEFLTKWSQPAIWITLITSILYGVVWLVQLNVATIAGVEERSEMLTEIKFLRLEIQSQNINAAKTAAVLEAVVRTQNTMEVRMTRNEGNISRNTRHRHAGNGE